MPEIPPMPLEEFRRRLTALGLVVPTEREAELMQGLDYLQALAARLHKPYGYGDEPMHVFTPMGPTP